MSGTAQPQRESLASVYPTRDRTTWIVGQRPARAADPDPSLPQGVFLERERLLSGEVVDSGVVLLTNRECPWKCLMCDLWQHTTRETVPVGAIPRQIGHAIRRWSQAGRLPLQVKLYNSGSFFDANAIPLDDYEPVVQQIAFARNLIVESHPLLIGERAVRLRDLWFNLTPAGSHGTPARSLEVAMGLETAHPDVLEKLNKRFTLEQFARAADFLRRESIALRVFLLVHPPFLSAKQPREHSLALEWLVKSVEFAFGCGATAVSLIPTRTGNGAMDRLRGAGEFAPPTLAELETAARAALEASRGRGRVFVDTWGLEGFSACPECGPARRGRLEQFNLAQSVAAAPRCQLCS